MSNQNSEHFADFIKGTCMTMCPEKERLLRERENLLHQLEIADDDSGIVVRRNVQSGQNKRFSKADPNRTVKCFSRSAAGLKTPDPSDLRPAPVLKETVGYLLNEIAADCINVNGWLERYQFVADRLRAVRQDMVIQNLPVSDSIEILEPIVRFHCYSSYRLCEESLDKYDPKLNSHHLQECMKRLLVLYDSVNQADGEVARKSLGNQCEMEALYLTLNLGDAYAISRALERNSSSKVEQLALQLSLAWLFGNYIRVGRIIESLPPLPLCAVAQQLPFFRRRALEVMTEAFSSKTSTVPMSYLTTILKWPDTKQAIRDCTYYGLPLGTKEGETCVLFFKGFINSIAQQLGPRRECWIEDILQKSEFKKLMFPVNSDES